MLAGKERLSMKSNLKFKLFCHFFPFQKDLVFSYFLFALALRAPSTFSKISLLYLRTKVYRDWVHFHLWVNYHFKKMLLSINTLMHNVFLRCPLLSRCPPSFISLHLPPSLCPSLFRVWDEQSVIVERPQHTARDINTHFSCSCQNKGPYEKRNRDSFFVASACQCKGLFWLLMCGVYLQHPQTGFL